jgi:hypothetical protein
VRLFPKGLKVHIDEYEVPNKASLALLFRQFDDRKSNPLLTGTAWHEGCHLRRL